MPIKIYPKKAAGTVAAPPSKSIAHRALICGALSGGSKIHNIELSDDITATLGALKAMGTDVNICDDSVTLGGLDPFNIPEGAELFCNESGSTLRFLIPLALLSGNKMTLTGAERLFERPLTIYEEICKEQNIYYEKHTDSLTVCGRLRCGDYSVRGDISSQFITGLLLALSLLDGKSTLTVTGKFESESYVKLTLSVMESFGVTVERVENTFYIDGNAKFGATEFVTEGDCSNAAFLEAFNLLGGDVTVTGLSDNTLQGDRVYKDMFEGLKRGEKHFDLSDCPDLAPVMFAMAAAFGGAKFSGTERLQYKESYRDRSMAKELLKFGIECEIDKNSVVIKEGALCAPTEQLWGHRDHRIVMALSLLASVTGGTIRGAGAVNKSFPLFFKKINSLGIRTEYIGD